MAINGEIREGKALMEVSEARKNVLDYYEISNPSESDSILFTESLHLLIEKTKDPKYMSELAWFYCERKQFDLEYKYLQMAAECGFGPACEELGYMYYYGQHGDQNYEKAFEYFSIGAKPDKYGHQGSKWCKYKLADMYHYGCFVEQDDGKYRQMIEEIFDELAGPAKLNDPVPEVFYRIAKIRVKDGDTEEAINLLRYAKDFMAERVSYGPFWGHIEVMGRIVRLLQELTPLDQEKADFYDLFYILRAGKPATFKRNGIEYLIEVSEDEEHALHFTDKWYRDFEDLCNRAEVDGVKITAIYDEFYDFKTIAKEEEAV